MLLEEINKELTILTSCNENAEYYNIGDCHSAIATDDKKVVLTTYRKENVCMFERFYTL